MALGSTELRRGHEPTRRWEVATPRLSPGLERFVLRCCGYREWLDGAVARVEMPLASIVIDICLGGEPLSVKGVTMPRGFVAGLSEVVCPQSVGASQEGIQLFLTPGAAVAVCGVSSAELAGSVIGFDALGAAHRELASRLREEGSWQRRFTLLDAWLCDRFAKRARLKLIDCAVSVLRDDARPRIEALAHDAGCSTRHLRRVFTAEVGMPPKAYARLARFGRLVSRLRTTTTSATPSWASLAAELGFADQAHLIREVRHFAGSTPRTLGRGLEVFAPGSTAAGL